MVRYSLLRLLIFFAFLLLLWFIPWMRHNPIPLVIAAGALSMVTSYFALAQQRNQIAGRLAERVEARQFAREERDRLARTDEDDEDDEDEG
ncbi:MAG TPA: DUF4229 domain-containing protein [Segeticoccus sp.]|uniref:DUF4229 domain-containing protein n=1 Tax=Segeticoccus sp. TaxID=2706531 RepID=UPI002D7EE3CB|nr:DUF4229 domain-containing protein [Segeticoccus sp.]HET8601074.1 DUF4229 domain-containing protein [Segeticoccus sp.]